MMPWYEDESFWEAGYSFMFSEEAFRAAVEQVDGLLALTGVQQGGVLDLGCGPGRHAVPLARRGFDVTAVDLSRFLLGEAQRYATAEKVTPEFVRADMRAFRRPDTFGLALSLFSSFGYFDDRAEDRNVAENLYISLRSGGALVMDLMSKELTGRFLPARITEVNGALRVERHTIVDDWTRIKSDVFYIRDSAVQRFDYSVRIYSGQELRELLQTSVLQM
jgi:SAM-dependent methyltransferase